MKFLDEKTNANFLFDAAIFEEDEDAWKHILLMRRAEEFVDKLISLGPERKGHLLEIAIKAHKVAEV